MRKTNTKAVARLSIVPTVKSGALGTSFIGFVLERYDEYWLAKGMRPDGSGVSLVADGLSDLALQIAIVSIQEERHAITGKDEKIASITIIGRP